MRLARTRAPELNASVAQCHGQSPRRLIDQFSSRAICGVTEADKVKDDVRAGRRCPTRAAAGSDRGPIRHDAEMARGLFGRSSELATIARALEAAGSGQARVVALVGEPGIGKTRLTIEAAARASELAFVACWGRAWEAGGAPPYWPWRQLLDALPGIDRDGALAQLWGRGNIAAADRDQARFALFEAVAAAIRRASTSAPLLCVLDDLHAADLPLLELAAFATRDLRTSRVAWLLTWRDAEAQRPPVCDLIARVAREAELIPLRRLSADDATQLARDARSETPVAVRDAIVAATAGNPLFLLETLACFNTRETLDVARLPLAQGIGAIVRERLAPLPPAVRRLLEAAALIGRDVEAPRWAIAADVPCELVRERAQDIRATGILENLDIDRWRFSHDLVREAIATMHRASSSSEPTGGSHSRSTRTCAPAIRSAIRSARTSRAARGCRPGDRARVGRRSRGARARAVRVRGGTRDPQARRRGARCRRAQQREVPARARPSARRCRRCPHRARSSVRRTRPRALRRRHRARGTWRARARRALRARRHPARVDRRDRSRDRRATRGRARIARASARPQGRRADSGRKRRRGPRHGARCPRPGRGFAGCRGAPRGRGSRRLGVRRLRASARADPRQRRAGAPRARVRRSRARATRLDAPRDRSRRGR